MARSDSINEMRDMLSGVSHVSDTEKMRIHALLGFAEKALDDKYKLSAILRTLQHPLETYFSGSLVVRKFLKVFNDDFAIQEGTNRVWRDCEGELHNSLYDEDGQFYPAVIRADGTREYWLSGTQTAHKDKYGNYLPCEVRKDGVEIYKLAKLVVVCSANRIKIENPHKLGIESIEMCENKVVRVKILGAAKQNYKLACGTSLRVV